MSLEPEDSAVVRSTAEDVKRYTRIALKIQTALVTLTAVVVVGTAISLFFIAQDNHRGVERIVSCTTEGYECYEEQKARTDALISTFLIELNREHLALKCILNVLPAERSKDDIAECDRQARAETDRVLAELRAKAEETAKIPQKKEGD